MSERLKPWLTSIDQENWSHAEGFETREEAIAHPPEGCELGQTYYVAKRVEYRPFVHGDHVIDSVVDAAWDFAGEHTESWLAKVPAEQVKELGARLTAAFEGWLKDTGNEPTFFQVDCVSSHYAPSALFGMRSNVFDLVRLPNPGDKEGGS